MRSLAAFSGKSGDMLERTNHPTDKTGSGAAPLSAGLSDPALLVARILVGYIFLLGGWGKLSSVWSC